MKPEGRFLNATEILKMAGPEFVGAWVIAIRPGFLAPLESKASRASKSISPSGSSGITSMTTLWRLTACRNFQWCGAETHNAQLESLWWLIYSANALLLYVWNIHAGIDLTNMDHAIRDTFGSWKARWNRLSYANLCCTFHSTLLDPLTFLKSK